MFSKCKIIVDTVKETFSATKSNWISLCLPAPCFNIDCNGTSITYIVHNEAVLRFIGLPSSVPGAGVVYNEQGVANIIVNDAFLSIPEEVQKAILLHEKGHIVNKDFASKNYLIKRLLGNKEILQQEFKADLYSFQQGGDMLSSLQWMYNSGFYQKKEILKRLRNLYLNGCN